MSSNIAVKYQVAQEALEILAEPRGRLACMLATLHIFSTRTRCAQSIVKDAIDQEIVSVKRGNEVDLSGRKRKVFCFTGVGSMGWLIDPVTISDTSPFFHQRKFGKQIQSCASNRLGTRQLV